jgi:hypothetical protein
MMFFAAGMTLGLVAALAALLLWWRQPRGRSPAPARSAGRLPAGWQYDVYGTCQQLWRARAAGPNRPWHVSRRGKPLGVYSAANLKQLARRGELRADDLLWTQGMAGWKRADSVPAVRLAPPPDPGAGRTRAAGAHAVRRIVRGTRRLLGRFWHGTLPLRVHWEIWLLCTLSLSLLLSVATPAQLAARVGSGRTSLAIAGVLGGTCLLAIAFSVGLWRAGDRSLNEGRGSLLPWVGRAAILLGLLHLVAYGFDQSALLDRALALTESAKPVKAPHVTLVRVLHENSGIEVSGPVLPRTATQLGAVLRRLPDAQVIELVNVHGRLAAAAPTAALIAERPLATFTAAHCEEACLLLFLSGGQRYLGEHAQLTFPARAGADTRDTQLLRRALVAHEVSAAFIEQALGNHALPWSPTPAELLDAHVVTAGVAEQVYAAQGFTAARARVLAEFAAQPAFAALEPLEPEQFLQLRSEYLDGVLSGSSAAQMRDRVRAQVLTRIVPRYARVAPDAELIAYWHTQLDLARELRAIDARDCAAFLAPTPETDTSRIAALFSDQARSAELAALADLLRAGALHPAAIPSAEAVAAALRESARRTERSMPGAVRIVSHPQSAQRNPGEFCRAEVTFYEAVLALPAHRAGPVLRYLVAQG